MPRPCPFCGSDATHVECVGEDEFFVECKACGATGPCRETESGAIVDWNLCADHRREMSVTTEDPVERPAHYEGDGEVPCMRALRSMMTGADVTPTQAYWWGCAFKYLWRWPHKGGRQDLEKASRCIEYLLDEI